MTELEKDYTRIIAEFDGWFIRANGNGIQKKIKDTDVTIVELGGFKDLKYHVDYNWLIPAWVKFRGLSLEDAFDHLILSDSKDNICRKITHGTIDEAFTALAEAIKWYNENKG